MEAGVSYETLVNTHQTEERDNTKTQIKILAISDCGLCILTPYSLIGGYQRFGGP
jgi:hypothetical protein